MLLWRSKHTFPTIDEHYVARKNCTPQIGG